MDREKLQQNPLPIDRVAARVVKKAKPEDVWRPIPKKVPTIIESATALAVAPLPHAAPAYARELAGKRRDRMVVVGYAAQQGSPKQQAKWVVRCDCGNYEHRTKILRWLGTVAPDMCRECRNRTYKLHGEWCPREPAQRTTSTKALT